MDLRTAETTLQFAEEASAAATGPDAKNALERFEARLDDLLVAMDWFLDAGRIDAAFRVANALYRFWITKQRFAEGAVAFERVLAIGKLGPNQTIVFQRSTRPATDNLSTALTSAGSYVVGAPK